MQSESEVGDELGAGDENEEENGPVMSSDVSLRSRGQPTMTECSDGTTHPIPLFSIHTSPSIQPRVVSPRNASQLRTRFSENAVPYTRVVNRIKAVAEA